MNRFMMHGRVQREKQPPPKNKRSKIQKVKPNKLTKTWSNRQYAAIKQHQGKLMGLITGGAEEVQR